MRGANLRAAALAALAFIAAAPIFSSATADEVGAKNREANRLYAKGRYEEALKLYDDALLLDPSDGRLKMNRGAALYRLGELGEAEKSYQEALGSRLGKRALADAHYNLGDVLYRQAEKSESAGDAAAARKKYSGALESYVNALKLRPNDMDAKWNLQLAHQKINMLKDMRDKGQGEDDKDDKGGEGGKDNKDNKDNEGGEDNKDNKNDKGDKGDKDDRGVKGEQDDKGDGRGQGGEQPQPRQDDDGGGGDDRRKEDANRLIELYADDFDTLNKPKFQRAKIRQPEKDW